jgi:hypothetical protein
MYCPYCGSPDATPIVYGLPTAESSDAAERGEIILAGCRFSDDSPAWEGRRCHDRFGIPSMLGSHDTADADSLVIGICREVADRMTNTGLPGTRLRERRHLDPFMKDAFMDATGARPVSKRFDHPHFRGLGAVDVVTDRPLLFMELKWSYERPGKIFESVWDAIKLAMLGPQHGRSHLYIATGASDSEWQHGDCADLFAGGPVEPLEMWRRPLVPRRGPNYGATVGSDLVIGANGKQPTQGPTRISTRLLDRFAVANDFRLKLIRIDGTTDTQPWPPEA